MFFSVVVPVYKAEPYLKQCVESILQQDFANFELILVDDGSPDSCPEICDAYAAVDHRVKVIHQKNGGPVCARKTGANAATGEYVVTVDSDDFVGPTFLSTIHATISRCDCDVVAFGATAFDGKTQFTMGNNVPSGLYVMPSDEILGKLMFDAGQKIMNYGNLLFSLWSKAIRTELLQEYQGRVPDAIRKGDDLAVCLPILLRCKSLAVISHYEYHYRINPSSIMHSFSEKDVFQTKILYEYLFPYCRKTLIYNLDMCVCTMCTDYLVQSAVGSKQYKKWRAYAEKIYEQFGDQIRSCRYQCFAQFASRIKWMCFKNKNLRLLYYAQKLWHMCRCRCG